MRREVFRHGGDEALLEPCVRLRVASRAREREVQIRDVQLAQRAREVLGFADTLVEKCGEFRRVDLDTWPRLLPMQSPR